MNSLYDRNVPASIHIVKILEVCQHIDFTWNHFLRFRMSKTDVKMTRSISRKFYISMSVAHSSVEMTLFDEIYREVNVSQ